MKKRNEKMNKYEKEITELKGKINENEKEVTELKEDVKKMKE